MANRQAFESLHDVIFKQYIELILSRENFESIKDCQIERSIMKKKTIIPFYKKKIPIRTVKFIVDENLAVIESMTKGLDFKEILSNFDLDYTKIEVEYI